MQNIIVTHYAGAAYYDSKTIITPIKYKSPEQFIADYKTHFESTRDNPDGPSNVMPHDDNMFMADGCEFALGSVNSAGEYRPLDKFREDFITVQILENWFEMARIDARS